MQTKHSVKRGDLKKHEYYNERNLLDSYQIHMEGRHVKRL